MHEMSIAQNILEIVREHVPPGQESAVRAIRLRVGEQSGVVADSLEFCFTAMVSGTPMEHAVLDIVEIPLVARCGTCGTESRSEFGFYECPKCGGTNMTLVSGSELQIVEIELDEGSDGAG